MAQGSSGGQKTKLDPAFYHLVGFGLLALFYTFFVVKHTPAWIIYDNHVASNTLPFEKNLAKFGAMFPYLAPDICTGLAVIGLCALFTKPFLDRIMVWLKLGHTGDMAKQRSIGIQNQTLELNKNKK